MAENARYGLAIASGNRTSTRFPLGLDTNGYQPASSSPLLGAGADLSEDSFFDSTDFVGAFDSGSSADWTLGWVTVGLD